MATKLIVERKTDSKHAGKLTEQQKSFVEHLLASESFDLTEAARKADYKSPGSAGQKLIKNKIIAALVGHRIKQRNDRLSLTSDAILARLQALLDADLTELYDEEGNCSMERIKALPPVIRQCISKIKTFRKFDIDEDGNKTYYNIYEVEWMSKDQALSLAMRHFGLITPEINVMVISDEVKSRVLVELLQQTTDPNKTSVIDGNVISRMVHEK